MRSRLCELRDAAREGDDHATAALVLALQPAVWAYCSNVGPAGEQVALVEATFLQAFQGLRENAPCSSDSDVELWVLRHARQVCAVADRTSQRQRRRAARSPWGAGVDARPPEGVRALALERREVWVLCTVLGFDQQRAAQVIEASLATVSVRLAAARRDLQPGAAVGL